MKSARPFTIDTKHIEAAKHGTPRSMFCGIAYPDRVHATARHYGCTVEQAAVAIELANRPATSDAETNQ